MRKPTNAQRRQRQLSWILRITMGFKQNLYHAGGMGDEMTDADHRLVFRLLQDLESAEERLRIRLHTRPYTRRD